MFRVEFAAVVLVVLGGCVPPESARRDPPVPTAAPLERPSAEEAVAAADAAPAVFKVKFETTKGDFIVEAQREWSPNGADRFHQLVQQKFYDDVAFFRVIEGFMAQVGIHGDPQVMAKWRDANIMDDPAIKSNTRGYVSFATSGRNSRSTQFFINFGDNSRLDGMGFSPFGKVVEGMDVVDSLYAGYGEGAPDGRGPAQGRLQQEGNEYLRAEFPKLDYIKRARVVGEATEGEGKGAKESQE